MTAILLILAFTHCPTSGQTKIEPPRYADRFSLLQLKNQSGITEAIKTPEQWRYRRLHILQSMQIVMGYLPRREKPDLEIRILESVRTENYLRQEITFVAEAGDRVPAYLLLPYGAERSPAVLCLHQTTKPGKAEPAGLAGDPTLHYAHKLAESGYVALAPDYPGFGDYSADPYAQGYVSATMKGIWNHMRAVDLLCSLAEVDAERIGAIGHSLGGHNSLFLAAFDSRIKCVVTNCGFCSFRTYYSGNLAGWSHRGYMPRIRSEYALDPAKMPFEFSEVLAAIAPRPVLVIAPKQDTNFAWTGAQECVNAALPVYELHHCAEKLAAIYPDAGHAFTPEAWQQARDWLDKWLKGKSRK